MRLNTMPALEPHVLSDVNLLAKRSSGQLRALGRLAHPLRRRRGEHGFTRISWNQALDEIAARVRATDPARLAFYLTSRGITNEVYYVAQKVARFLGTPNVENSARLCHAPSTSGLKATVGVGASTVSYKDWIESDLLVFLGSNFANDQPVATKYVDLAKKRGARVLAVNTYREPGLERYWIPSTPESALFGTKLVDRFFLVHTGGDLAFLNGVAKLLLAKGAADQAFLAAHTTGFDEWKAALDGQSFAELEKSSGATRAEMEAFADEIARARSGILIWSMGITQHAHGTETVKAIANLALLRGWIGRAGAGLVPIRGHSGVQGGAEMGAYATVFPGGLPIDDENARALERAWGFAVPARKGLSTAEMLDASRQGNMDLLYSIGGNFLETLPSPALVEEALARVPVRVHEDVVLTSQMLVEPKDVVYVLPATTRYEQKGGGTETSTERRVIFSPTIEGAPPGEARSEWEVLQEIAARARPELASKIRFASGAAIRREIARVIPAYKGIETLRRAGDQFQWGGPRLCEGGVFPLPGGKARFAKAIPPTLAPPAGSFRLATRRGKQFNSMIQDEVDALTGARREDILISSEDLAAMGLGDGARIVVENEHGRLEGRAKAAPVRPGNLQAHWPEANVLIAPGCLDPGGLVPDYNAIVNVRRL
jgi:molybdopterin-dependent oxidoreductase alpha subunit